MLQMDFPCGNQWYSNTLISYSVLELLSMYEHHTGFTLWDAAIGWTLQWSCPQPTGHWILTALVLYL